MASCGQRESREIPLLDPAARTSLTEWKAERAGWPGAATAALFLNRRDGRLSARTVDQVLDDLAARWQGAGSKPRKEPGKRMALRWYRCLLLRPGKAHFSDKTVFRQVSEFTYELDPDEGMGHTIRAALLNGALQDGGQEAGIGQYRLTVLDDKSRVPLHEYAAGPAPAAGPWPAGPLTSHTGEQLVSELLQRLKTRSPRSSWQRRGTG